MPTDITTSLAAVYIAVGAVALLIMGLNPRWLPALLVLVMPTGNLDLEGPVTFTLSKIVLLVFVITLPAQIAAAAREIRRIEVPLSLGVFLLIAIICTLGSLAWSGDMSSEGFDTLRGPVFRPIVQLVSLGLRVSAFVGIQMWASDRASWARICKATLFASTAAAVYGVYQFIGYYKGWPVMAIHRSLPGASDGYAFFTIGSLDIFRVGSFVGEPKGAALVLLPSIVLITFARSTGIVCLRSWLTSVPVLVLHVIVFILTFATSSFFGLLISLPILSYLLWRVPGRIRTDRLIIITLVLVLAVGGTIVFGGGGEFASEVLRARTTERLGSMATPEGATVDFLMDHPRTLLTGIGLGNASFYLRPYFDPNYFLPLTVTLDSGYLQILLEGGLIALLAFIWFLGGSLIRARRCALQERDDEHRGMLMTTLAVCVVLAGAHAFVTNELQIWIFWGLLFNLCGREARLHHSWVPTPKPLFRQTLTKEAI